MFAHVRQRRPVFRGLSFLLSIALIFQSCAAAGQVVTAPGGGARTGEARNGVPVVNIAAPNDAGLSHNKYLDYNVGREGLILNNATNSTQNTQLGGVILGNDQLGGHAAKRILNEVIGGNPSQLLGYTEVAGQAAHVIIANPHGIACNGCGFINTPRATLTTGKPVFEQGQLYYDVEGGQIRLEGLGLNAENIDQFELIARSARINAELHAQKLALVTGTNRIDADTLDIAGQVASVESAPQFALDSTALGGMYARRIRLIGTEAGVGVRLAGDMATSGGDIEIDAAGRLQLAAAHADGQIRLKAQSLEATHTVSAGEYLQLQATRLDNSGALISGGYLALVAQDIHNTGTLGAGGDFYLKGDALSNHAGLLGSGGDMTLFVQRLDNRAAEIYSLGALRILGDENGGWAQSVQNRSGVIESGGALDIAAGQLDNIREEGPETRTRKLSARLVDDGCSDCRNTNEDRYFRLEEIDRSELVNAESLTAMAQIAAGGDLNLTGDDIRNHYSLIRSGGDLNVVSNTLDNLGAQTGDVSYSRRIQTDRIRARYIREALAEAEAFNARNWIGSAFYAPGDIAAELNQFLKTYVTYHPIPAPGQITLTGGTTYAASIQAAGEVNLRVAHTLNNGLVQPRIAFVNGAENGDIAAYIRLSAQQAVGAEPPPLTLPGWSAGENGRFRLAAGHNYLIERNPLFAGTASFLNSDYLLALLGYDPDQVQKRLGDGGYEQRLVREALASAGARYLAGQDDEALYRMLMDNALAQQESLRLSLGVGLSGEQIAALSQDIVWLEEREALGEKVLTPVVYFAPRGKETLADGALIAGRRLNLESGRLENQGVLRAADDLVAAGVNLDNSGRIEAGKQLDLLAQDNIHNTRSGVIRGGDVRLTAVTGEVANVRSLARVEGQNGGHARQNDLVDDAARIEAAGTLEIYAGQDILNLGSVLQSGGALSLAAGRDIAVAAVAAEDKVTGRRYLWQEIQQYAAEVSGQDLDFQAGRNIGIIGSDLIAERDLSARRRQSGHSRRSGRTAPLQQDQQP
jgi:filamentous hemagglutinin